jgi:hypothetical protein
LIQTTLTLTIWNILKTLLNLSCPPTSYGHNASNLSSLKTYIGAVVPLVLMLIVSLYRLWIELSCTSAYLKAQKIILLLKICVSFVST